MCIGCPSACGEEDKGDASIIYLPGHPMASDFETALLEHWFEVTGAAAPTERLRAQAQFVAKLAMQAGLEPASARAARAAARKSRKRKAKQRRARAARVVRLARDTPDTSFFDWHARGC